MAAGMGPHESADREAVLNWVFHGKFLKEEVERPKGDIDSLANATERAIQYFFKSFKKEIPKDLKSLHRFIGAVERCERCPEQIISLKEAKESAAFFCQFKRKHFESNNQKLCDDLFSKFRASTRLKEDSAKKSGS